MKVVFPNSGRPRPSNSYRADDAPRIVLTVSDELGKVLHRPGVEAIPRRDRFLQLGLLGAEVVFLSPFLEERPAICQLDRLDSPFDFIGNTEAGWEDSQAFTRVVVDAVCRRPRLPGFGGA